MRDILFRGKTVDNGGWVEGNLIHRKLANGKSDYLIESCDFHEYRQWEVIPESVGQFIGLPNKNGVKIFDGDVLENEDGDEVCHTLIFWDDTICGFSDKRDFDGDSFTIHNGDMLWVLDCEVIGNIFDSPDLIK